MNFEFADFHTHLDFYSPTEIDTALECINQNKILTIAASVNTKSYNLNQKLKLKVQENLIIPTFGVHPSYAQDLPKDEKAAVDFLSPYFKDQKLIGEVGMDFFWEKELSADLQKLYFEIALDFADKNKSWCVIHTKGAEKFIQSELKHFGGAKPIIHWYDGPMEILEDFNNSGYYQTFGCQIYYSETIKDFLRATPDQLILAETDNPTGEPWLGGSDNSPLLIKRVYKDICQVKNWDLEEGKNLININTKKILTDAKLI